MNKKVTLFLTTMILGFSLSSYADDITGEMVFARKLKVQCGFKGDILCKMHTQSEWENLYKEGKLYEEVKERCPQIEPMKEDHLKHLYEFLHKYAKDIPSTPVC